MTGASFRGPGQWRSQAESARGLDGNVFSQLDEMARRLHDLGLDEPEEQVRKAAALAREDPDKASEMLAATARLLGTIAPPYGQGLSEIARGLPQHREQGTGQVSDDDGIPDLDPR
jgi:hypothetical protein